MSESLIRVPGHDVSIETTDDGEATRAACPCGYRGPWTSEPHAYADSDAHFATVARDLRG